MIDPTDALRERYARGGWETFSAEDGLLAVRMIPTTADDVAGLCDEVDRLRAEVDALADALADIADGECLCMDDICHQVHPDDPDEWCPTCAAETCWSAWKMGALG